MTADEAVDGLLKKTGEPLYIVELCIDGSGASNAPTADDWQAFTGPCTFSEAMRAIVAGMELGATDERLAAYRLLDAEEQVVGIFAPAGFQLALVTMCWDSSSYATFGIGEQGESEPVVLQDYTELCGLTPDDEAPEE